MPESPRQKYRNLDARLPSQNPQENLILSRQALIQRNLDPACRDRLDFLRTWCLSQLALQPVILAVEPALRCLLAGFKSHDHQLVLLGTQALLKIHQTHPASLFRLSLQSARGMLADAPEGLREDARQCLEQIQSLPQTSPPSLFEQLYENAGEATCLALLKDPASAYEIEFEEDNCLELAIQKGFLSLASELIRKGYPLMLRGAMNRTPLHTAALMGQLDMIKLLIVSGSPLNLLDLDGQSPAHRAILHHKPEALELLLRAGLDANLLNAQLEPLSLLAARQKMDSGLRLLRTYGADFRLASPSGESAHSLGCS